MTHDREMGIVCSKYKCTVRHNAIRMVCGYGIGIFMMLLCDVYNRRLLFMGDKSGSTAYILMLPIFCRHLANDFFVTFDRR